MLYLKLSQLYEEISSTTKRLEKIDLVSKFLENLPEKDKDVLHLLLGNIYADYDETKTGISEQLVIKSISKTTGENKEKIVKEWKKTGDLGEVAQNLTKNKKQSTLFGFKTLTIEKILESLRKLHTFEGEGTVDKKISIITELLTSANPIEAKYIVRTLIGDLRIGIQESTIREAIAKTFFSENQKEASKKIQEALDRSNDIALIFEIAKKKDLKKLENVSVEVGKPIKVMLAQKVSTIKDGFEIVGKPCAIEYKYDGFRIIIHKKDNKIILYTRRLENVTKQFPEVVEYVKKYIDGKSFILDSEAVGFDKKTKKYMPFQAISQRIKRKYDIEKISEELPVEINVFDIIYYEGKSLLNEPFHKRAEVVRKIVHNTPYKIISAKQIITDNLIEAEKFYKKALADNQEGVMMKNLNSVYQPGSRVGHMLKIKPSEKDFDLVITGAEYGQGKRSGWLTSFTLSCYDEDSGKFLEIGKVGTGISEKAESTEGTEKTTFDELTKLLKPLITKEEGKNIFVKPKIVVAVTYQEIQKSPTYSSGYALRFPRVTALRPDKPVNEIATLSEIKKDY